MKKIIISISFLFAWCCAVMAQQTPSVGDGPLAGATNFPLCSKAWKQTANPEPFPSGENHAGWGYFYNTKKRCFEFEPAFVLTGQGAIAANISITASTWTALDGAIGANGFRPNLAQYTPTGTYDLIVKVTFSTSTTNAQYELAVTQGLTLQTSGAQKNIAIGTGLPGTSDNIFLAAGYCTSPGTASNPFECTAIVPKFQCPVARGQACEIRTWVWTSDTAGTALASSPNTGANYVSTLLLHRVRGLENQQ